MKSRKTISVFQYSPDLRDGNGGRVGGQNTILVVELFDLAEDLLFYLDIFDHRFDDKINLELTEVAHGSDAVQRGSCILLRDLFFHDQCVEVFPESCNSVPQERGLNIIQ